MEEGPLSASAIKCFLDSGYLCFLFFLVFNFLFLKENMVLLPDQKLSF